MKIKRSGVHSERLIQDCNVCYMISSDNELANSHVCCKYSNNISKPVKDSEKFLLFFINYVQPQTSYWALK